MADVWPATLPDSPLVGTYSEVVEVNTAEFQPEVGGPKRRRRSSVKSSLLNFSLAMTTDHVATLDTFYVDTLKDGVLEFTFTQPRTQATITCEFVQPPEISYLAPDYYTVALQLRKIY